MANIGLAAVLLIGIGAGFPNPGTYVQVNFAAGASSGSSAAKNALIIGNRSTAGSATPDTVIYGPDTQVPVQSEQDVINVFGPGSQCHRAWRRFNSVNKTTAVYFLAVTESAGAAATGQVLFTGTATSNGNARFWVGDEFVDSPITIGDTPTTQATNLAGWINAQTNWSITASATAGAVSITWKNKGPEGNWGKIQVQNGPGFLAGGVTISVSGTAWVTGAAATLTTFTTPTTPNGYYYKITTVGGTPTFGSAQPTWPTTIGTATSADSNGNIWTCWGTLSGAGIAQLGGGTTADSNTLALSTIDSTRFRYIILCDSDSTNVGRAASQVNIQAQPLTGIRQQLFYGSVDTLANAITSATALNSPTAECQWGYATDVTPLEIAAHNAAIYSLWENSGNRPVGRLNYSLYPVNATDAPLWTLSGTRNGPAYGPTTNQITSALNNGLSPIALRQDGSAYLVKRCTTRSLNGSTPDYRIRDAHKVSIMWSFADDAQAITQENYGGKDLLDDPKQGGPPLPNTATSPRLWKGTLDQLVEEYGTDGLLQNADDTTAAAIVQREANPRTRMSAQYDLQTADIADQFATVLNQVA